MTCARQIWKLEGSMGYIRGLKPCLIRAVLGDGIGIVVYEKCQEGMAAINKH
jgi:hypothetical protein